MVTPKEHIEEIRKTKFSIGGELNPLTEDLHQAVKNLSAELYSKDVHFLMELIQNAEDNQYSEGVDPSLEFVITSRDITGTGAPATLLVFNNEKGFSPSNIESICGIGRSTKKGNRNQGYIGEKGIGFKSVFLITAQPYIFSNGYQMRFNEEPCMHCNLGYIVPEWVEESPTLSDITKIYGSGSALPNTTLILPLKPDKVKPVKQQLSSVHPELLLFLAKIKRLSVREDNEDPMLNTVTAIAISIETDFVTRKNIDADSYTLHLSAKENGNELKTECRYYMWKQKFPVQQECRDEKRMEVDEWVITLAFPYPYGERLNRGTSSPGVYAFLPTEMITNLPFIIQADFLLASSRENILLDKKWNQGILNCVPSAFINAFLSLVKSIEDAPVSSLPYFFRFLPVQSSPYDVFNVVRESIKAQLVEKDIVPCEPHKEQKFFHKPSEVGRLLPAFWKILMEAREVGVSLPNLSSHGKYVLCHSFDQEEYDHILSFLGVEPVDDEWYAKCIQSSNLVRGVSEDVYLELLLFIADNWGPKFLRTNIKNVPLIKYVDLFEGVSLCSLSSMRTGEKNVCLSRHSDHVSWLIDWNREFISAASLLFMPEGTQEAMQSCSNKDKLVKWLAEEMKVAAVNVYEYSVCLCNSLNEGRSVVAYAHFLYHSFCKSFISNHEVDDLCGKMPLVNDYGNVIRERRGVIVPANESKWAGLTDSNMWKEDGFVQLGEDYMNPGRFAGKITEQKQLLEFLKVHAGASDVPYISAPNGCLPTVSTLLSIQKTFLLLDWIHHLRYQRVHIPEKFLKCIKEGSWLKVTLNGFSVSRPPSQSFVLEPSWGNILQNGSVFVDIPLVDKSYYGERIDGYKEELKTIGVMFEVGEACEFIGKHLMSLAASSTLTRRNVLSILHFIKLLRDKCLPPDNFISSIKSGPWLKTKSHGYRSPVGSVLFDQEWKIASKISDIPFIDEEVYGKEILDFKTELGLLGVVVSFNKNYQLIVDHLKSPSCLPSLAPEAVLLMLQIMHISNSSDKIVEALRGTKCLKTNNGYKFPHECLLFHSEWGCLLQVFSGLPLIDHDFYENTIFSFRDELRKIGVVVDFENTVEVFARHFRQYASSASITKENVASLLSCCRKLKGTQFRFPAALKNCIRDENWLRTRLGVFRSPRQCILFSPNWECISPICPLLPFIDDSENWYGKNIHEYKEELKSLGVVVEFQDGVKFVPSGFHLRKNPNYISRENTLALLKCIRILLQEKDYSFSDAFMKKVSHAWLKTGSGYRCPSKCLLFDSKFGKYLEQTDGPFIDEEFYGSEIAAYRQELSEIGVIVEAAEGCPLISSQLALHDEFPTFVRVYNYLSEFKWEPDSEADKRIWIPKGNQTGEWVNPDDCVIYDKDELFGLQLTVLKNYFEHNLLVYFSSAYKVKSRPSIDDYCNLWKVWESSETGLSHDQCCKFWGYVSKNWNSETEKALPEALVKVPVNSGSDEIFLLNKCDVFLPDDLQLKDLFEQYSTHPLFVWYPQPSLPDLPRTTLLEMYRKIGVRAISESVQKEEVSLENGVGEQVIPNEKLIGKAVVKLILGFLACPPIEIEAGKRQKAVQGLLHLTVVETTEPITVSYNLPLSSGEISNVPASRKIRWDREMSKFFTQKMDRSGGQKSIIEFATYFSQVISDGVLWEHTDHIPALSELIKWAVVLEFNEEAVDFLMKSKNLQIFIEDEEFLNSAFPSST